MAVIDVYEQYFAAEGEFNGVARRGALVLLAADSSAGHVSYEAAVSFFPHCSDEDFAVSYDAYFSQTLYSAPGRRSKKREAVLLERLRETVDGLAAGTGVRVMWNAPLREVRRG